MTYLFWGLPFPTQITSESKNPVSTQILDRNGKLIYEIFEEKRRTPIKLSDLPPYVAQATIAIEDAEFYKHHGLSLKGIGRALFKTTVKQDLQGGSTITQQLVKTTLLTPERTVKRKVREILLTLIIETIHSKDNILTMYLNNVPYGGTAWGIESASLTYFGKSGRELTLGEASLLAGLPQAPTKFSPFGANPQLAKDRQALVLDRMVAEKYITPEEAENAKKEDLKLSKLEGLKAPHFALYVKERLVEKYGEDLVERGGLRVTTTLDLDLQEFAQKQVAEEVGKLKKANVGNGASIVINPKTGEIYAMVGSKDYFAEDEDGKVNVTLRSRQPGSSIKPLNYALGLETKLITPSSMLLDTPICFVVPGQTNYCPKNYDNSFRGPTQIRFALGNSLNIPAVKVLALNGVENFISFAQKMGITSWTNPENYGLSLTLGGGEVTMLDMATAFGVFANQGVKVSLHPILKVTDISGNILEEYSPADGIRQGDNVLSEETSFLISHILSDNNARSGAFGSNSILNIPGKTVSVKTGTTNNLRDNWTIGYTPTLLVAAWVGNNDNSPMSYVASGITGASPIWQKIMKYGLRDINTPGLTKPDTIEGTSVCSDSGVLPGDGNACPTRYEYFLPNTIPSVSTISQRELFVNKTTHHPPQNEIEFADLETKLQTVASDPFVTDYCIDCGPYPEGYSEPLTTVPYSSFGNFLDEN